MSDVFPVRNLGPAEHWGRTVESRLKNLALLRKGTDQSTAGLGRYSASSAQDIANAAQEISDLATTVENAILVFPRPYVTTDSNTDWAVGAAWTTVATARVEVPQDKDKITVTALADLYTLQEAGPETADFDWPFSLEFVTSEFGPRPPRPYHRGIDFSYGGIEGDPIPAAAAGTVILNNYYDDWGNYIRIRHDDLTGVNDTWTGYAHLQSPSPLPVGSTVTKGQIIGQVGTTGYSSGPHLHFETALENERIDPRQFFDIFGGSTPGAAIATQGRVVIDGEASRAYDPPQGAGFKQAIRAMYSRTLTGKAGKTVAVQAQIRTGSNPLDRRPENIAVLTIKGAIE